MIHNQYWDLFECRWVTYRAADDPEAAADAVPAPRAAEDAGSLPAVPAAQAAQAAQAAADA